MPQEIIPQDILDAAEERFPDPQGHSSSIPKQRLIYALGMMAERKAKEMPNVAYIMDAEEWYSHMANLSTKEGKEWINKMLAGGFMAVVKAYGDYVRQAMQAEYNDKEEWSKAIVHTEGFKEGTDTSLKWIASWRNNVEKMRIYLNKELGLYMSMRDNDYIRGGVHRLQDTVEEFNELFPEQK